MESRLSKSFEKNSGKGGDPSPPFFLEEEDFYLKYEMERQNVGTRYLRATLKYLIHSVAL